MKNVFLGFIVLVFAHFMLMGGLDVNLEHLSPVKDGYYGVMTNVPPVDDASIEALLHRFGRAVQLRNTLHHVEIECGSIVACEALMQASHLDSAEKQLVADFVQNLIERGLLSDKPLNSRLTEN